MTIALSITVKGHRRLLLQNIAYHRLAGVRHFFVFLDRLDIFAYIELHNMDDVTVFLSGTYLFEDFAIPRCFSPQEYLSNHMVRQATHNHIALQLSQEYNVEWLVSIDVDELLYLHDATHSKPDLGGYFSKVEKSTAAISFQTQECIVTKWAAQNPFQEITLFKKPTNFGEGKRAEPHLMGEIAVRFGDRLLDAAISGSRIAHSELRTLMMSNDLGSPFAFIRDPISDAPLAIDWYLGHSLGKEAIRVSSGFRYKNVHCSNAPEQRRRKDVNCVLLHYNCFSFVEFVEKYRYFADHPDTYASGWQLDPFKWLCRNEFRKSGFHSLTTLFSVYVYYTTREVAEIQMASSALISNITEVSNMLGVEPQISRCTRM